MADEFIKLAAFETTKTIKTSADRKIFSKANDFGERKNWPNFHNVDCKEDKSSDPYVSAQNLRFILAGCLIYGTGSLIHAIGNLENIVFVSLIQNRVFCLRVTDPKIK